MEFGADSRIRVILSYFAIYVVWGSTYYAISVSLETLPVFFISSTRFLAAGTILIAWSLRKGAHAPTLANWVVAAKSGFLSFFCAFGLLTWAQQILPSSFAALIISLEPAWFVLLDWMCFGGAKPGRRVVLAQIVGFAGCAMLIFSEPTTPAAQAAPKMHYALSAMAVVVCSFVWVYGSLLSRSPDAHKDSTMASGIQMFSGGVALLAGTLLNGDYLALGGASLHSVLALLYLIFFGSVFAYSAFVFLLRTQPSAKVAAHTFVNPIVAVAIGWSLAGEAVTPNVLVAACLVVVSVILTIYAKPPEKA